MSDQIVDQLIEVQCSDLVSRLRAEVARLTAALAAAEAERDQAHAWRDGADKRKAMWFKKYGEQRDRAEAAEARAERAETVVEVFRSYVQVGESRPSAVPFAVRYGAWDDLRVALRAYDGAALAEQPGDRGPA